MIGNTNTSTDTSFGAMDTDANTDITHADKNIQLTSMLFTLMLIQQSNTDTKSKRISISDTTDTNTPTPTLQIQIQIQLPTILIPIQTRILLILTFLILTPILT